MNEDEPDVKLKTLKNYKVLVLILRAVALALPALFGIILTRLTTGNDNVIDWLFKHLPDPRKNHEENR